MLNYKNLINALHVRTIDFTLEEYLFVLQTILGEDPCVAYASVYEQEDFNNNIRNEDDDEDFFAKYNGKAEQLLETQSCKHIREYLEEEYRSEIQSRATNLKDFKFTGADIQQLLANLLHNRTNENLDDASVRDIIQLIKSMYDSGALDGSDSFQKHFITIPNKYNTVCPKCSHEGYAVEGLDFRCEFCGCIAKWDESQRRYFPNLGHL